MGFKEEIIKSFTDIKSDEGKRKQIALLEFIEEHSEEGNFTFYRAEDESERPSLNEDTGQAGRGVYFAVQQEVAEMFRSKRDRSIFKFSMDFIKFLKYVKPIFFEDEDIELLQDMDVNLLYEILQELGFRRNRYCVIIPMPDFGFEMQLVIPKKIMIKLIDKGYMRWEKVE